MPFMTNSLLSQLPFDMQSTVRANVVSTNLSKGSVIYAAGQTLEVVYFVTKGIAVLAWPKSAAHATVDLAMIGSNGMLGCAVSFGAPKATFDTLARTEVLAARMPSCAFENLIHQSPAFESAIVRFAASLTAQLGETAYVNARLTVEQRLARWIFLASESLNTSTIRFTHDELASAVGCRRAGVTVALHLLEGEKIIRALRSQIAIVDRQRLLRAFSDLSGGAAGESHFTLMQTEAPNR